MSDTGDYANLLTAMKAFGVTAEVLAAYNEGNTNTESPAPPEVEAQLEVEAPQPDDGRRFVISEETQDFFDRINQETEDDRMRGGGCPICKGLKFVVKDGEAYACECEKKTRLEGIYRAAGIPPNLWPFTLDHINTKQFQNGDDLGAGAKYKAFAKNILTAYVKVLPALCVGHMMHRKDMRHKQDFNSLFCVGGKQSGKSMMGAIAAKEAIARNLTTHFYTWSNLVGLLSSFDYRAEQDQLVDQFSFFQFIVVDGICDRKIAYPHFLLQLDRLFEARIAVKKPIFLSATEDWRGAQLGEALPTLIDSCLRFALPTPENTRPAFFIEGRL